MADKRPDVAVAEHLETALSLTMGATVFHEPELPPGGGVAEKAIFCVATGGAAPVRPFEGMASFDDYHSSVQVWVRSEAVATTGAYDVGLDLARSALRSLQASTPAGAVACTVKQSEPVYLGVDGYHRWVFVAELWGR